MCSSKAKVSVGIEASPPAGLPPVMARINGRPVLQPTCNRVPSLERRNSIKKLAPPPKSLSPPSPPPLFPTTKTSSLTPPASPRSSVSSLNSSSEKVVVPASRNSMKANPSLERKKSKSFKEGSCGGSVEASLSYSSSLITESPGSIAAVRREQVALQQAQRKLKIAHYGRSKSAKFDRVVVPLDSSTKTSEEEKRCSFITSNSDPIYIAYHDEEWGVPAHDDKMLFELLVLSGAQVDSDWTSILKKRQDFSLRRILEHLTNTYGDL